MAGLAPRLVRIPERPPSHGCRREWSRDAPEHGCSLAGALNRPIGVKDGLARSRTWGGGHALRQSGDTGVLGDGRSLQLLQCRRVDPKHRLTSVDDALVGHVHRQTHRRPGRPLAHPGLQDPEVPFSTVNSMSHMSR